jgi:hypothetical protein
VATVSGSGRRPVHNGRNLTVLSALLVVQRGRSVGK